MAKGKIICLMYTDFFGEDTWTRKFGSVTNDTQFWEYLQWPDTASKVRSFSILEIQILQGTQWRILKLSHYFEKELTHLVINVTGDETHYKYIFKN